MTYHLSCSLLLQVDRDQIHVHGGIKLADQGRQVLFVHMGMISTTTITSPHDPPDRHGGQNDTLPHIAARVAWLVRSVAN